jgi:hypothetical protein
MEPDILISLISFMKKNLTLTALFTVLAFSLTAQSKYENGIEGGPINCYYKITESQNNLKTVPCVSGVGGINFRYNSKKKVFIEAGVLLSEYTVGLALKQQVGYSTGNHNEVLFIPLRIGYPFKIAKKFSLVPSLGLTSAIKTLSQDGGSGFYVESNSNGTSSYQYNFRMLGKDLYFLANGNVSLEWTFSRHLKALAGLNYYHGLSQESVADVQYKINNEPPQTGLLSSKGSFLAYNFGFKYLLK